jgi:hypothetical protein
VSGARQASSVIKPEIDNKVASTLELADSISSKAEISVFQLLWFKFKSGDNGKFGGFSDDLGTPYTDDFSVGNFLWGSPASQRDAVSSAKYKAIITGRNDAIIETKVQVTNSGFSLLGIIGWGRAEATVEGRGVTLKALKAKNN